MTTTSDPAVRRLVWRQRWRRLLGVYIILVGIALIIQPIYFDAADRAQRRCLVHNFSELATALNARAVLTRKDTRVNVIERDATRLESQANSTFYRDAFAADGESEVFAAYARYRVTLAQVNRLREKVDRRRAHIAKERRAHPIPAFPAGTCS